MESSGPNAEQIRYWNEVAAPRWLEQEQALDAQIGPFGRAAMDRAGIVAGEHVLDVGCGTGDTTLELARRVGPDGSVVGLDISAPFLARARERAHGFANVRFENADAQIHAFEADRDLVFSRFGIMFFADPEAAFANLRGALRTGGRITFVCWQALQKNEWMMIPMVEAAKHVSIVPPPPGAPGPFAFADPDRVRGILVHAGFDDIQLDAFDTEVALGGPGASLERATDFIVQLGPMGTALRENPAALPRVVAAVKSAIAPFAKPEGVCMNASAWIATARND